MGLRRLAGGCDDGDTCPGIWLDDQQPDEMIVVGLDLNPSPVLLGPGERAVKLRRETVREAVQVSIDGS